MWRPTVLGEIPSVAATCLFNRPRAISRNTSPLALGEAGWEGGHGHPVLLPGGHEYRIDFGASEAAGAELIDQLGGSVEGLSAGRWGRTSVIAW